LHALVSNACDLMKVDTSINNAYLTSEERIILPESCLDDARNRHDFTSTISDELHVEIVRLVSPKLLDLARY
jgi:hypothetical protein